MCHQNLFTLLFYKTHDYNILFIPSFSKCALLYMCMHKYLHSHASVIIFTHVLLMSPTTSYNISGLEIPPFVVYQLLAHLLHSTDT